jgi:CRISPR-associated protein Csd2
MNRITLLGILEVILSNANGDPNNSGFPRVGSDMIGLLTAVSFLRKVRDLIAFKEGPVWQQVARELGITDNDLFRIAETNDRGFADADKSPAKNLERFRDLSSEEKLKHYVDLRMFGGTFPQKDESGFACSGAVKTSMGVSVAPVEIVTMTLTSQAVKEVADKKSMAPDAIKVVRHGLYTFSMTYCATRAMQSRCTKQDLAVLLGVLPYCYREQPSAARPQVDWLHLWALEHAHPLGSASIQEIGAALTPTVLPGVVVPTSSKDYVIPDAVPAELQAKLARSMDLAPGLQGPTLAAWRSWFTKNK